MTESVPPIASAPPVVTSAQHHFEVAWPAFRAHWRRFLIAGLSLFTSWVVLELCVVSLQRLGVVVNVVLHVAFVLFASGLMVGFHRMAIDAVDGRTPTLESLIGFLDRSPAYLLAWCMYVLAMAAGLVLLIAPGVLVAVRHAFFGQVLATRRVGGYEALRLAGERSARRWWAIFRVMALGMAFNLAGAACLGVGLLVTLPMSLLASTSLFRQIDSTPTA